MSSQVLDAIDDRIDAAEQDITRAKDVVGSARDLRSRLEEERQRARGQLTRGEPAALVDLDRVVDEIIGARRASQDAELALGEAQAKVQPLQKERQKAEQAELAAHLAPLLGVQAALAAQVDAAIGVLATTIGLYRAACHEAGAMAALLGIPAGGDTDQRAASRVARRLMTTLSSTLTTELRYTVTRAEALADSDRERTAGVRAAVEKMGPSAPAPGVTSA